MKAGNNIKDSRLRRKNSKANTVVYNILLLCVSITASLAIIEAMLAIGSYLFYPKLLVNDSSLGWKYKTTKKEVKRHFAKDVVYNLCINSDGFRDNEIIYNKDSYRIMVLGDSMTFGLEVNQDEIFCSVLEKKLRDKYAPKKIGVANMGITGFGTGQQLICLKKYGNTYKPNAVLLMLFECNDFSDNTSIMSAGRYTPHYELKNGKLILFNNPNLWQKVVTFLSDHSFLMYFFSNRSCFKKLFSEQSYLSEEGQIVLMCAILDEMSRYVRASGGTFLIFYIRDTTENDSKFKAIEEYCKQNNVFLRLIPLKSEERVHKVEHWNTKGHYSVAEIIYEVLSEKLSF